MGSIKQGNNKLYIGDEASPKAEITFKETGDNHITVDHTFVADELRGEGIAQKLVEHMANYARGKGKTIIPECPYVKKKMESASAYHDVLAKV